jgi:hypothetical protein
MARKEETQQSLTERFDALQDAILTIYEQGAKDLATQIKYWDYVRKEHVILYYARKNGYLRLGLQPTPTPAVSEYNAKEAIKMGLLLKSLARSKYANEEWTLQQTSAELINTQPKDCFKKKGYTVDVWYDHDKEKAFPYTNWDEIYYQDENEQWHKTRGEVDENGLYFTETNGDRTYFTIFEPDAERYGNTGEWTIYFNNTSIVSSSSYSKRTTGESTKRKRDESATASDAPSTSQSISPRRLQRTTVSSTSETSDIRPGRRGDQQGELSSAAKRRRSVFSKPSSYPTAEEVGTRHRSTQRTGLTRLQRLQADARDPPVVIVQGPANSLKCWRNRLYTKHSVLYAFSSTVWRWIGDSHTPLGSRMLISFDSITQRNHFLQVIKPPKHTAFALGSLDSL